MSGGKERRRNHQARRWIYVQCSLKPTWVETIKRKKDSWGRLWARWDRYGRSEGRKYDKWVGGPLCLHQERKAITDFTLTPKLSPYLTRFFFPTPHASQKSFSISSPMPRYIITKTPCTYTYLPHSCDLRNFMNSKTCEWIILIIIAISKLSKLMSNIHVLKINERCHI